MRALEAGQEAGGDRRGRQSAGVVTVLEEQYPWCDLRVDDHDDPVEELRRLLEVWKRELPFRSTMPRRDDYTPSWEQTLRVRDYIEADLEEETAVKES